FRFSNDRTHSQTQDLTAPAALDNAEEGLNATGLPFGPEYETSIKLGIQNFELDRNIFKRADVVTITVHDAICAGERILPKLQAGNLQASKYKTVKDLNDNGWVDDQIDEEDENDYHVSDIDSVLKELKIPVKEGRYFREARQMQNFLNEDNVHTKATNGFYTSEFNTKKGTIFALGTKSPKYIVETDENDPADTPAKVKARIPKVSRWSDVVWIHWADVCQKTGKDPSSLDYIFRYHVVTPNTQFGMEQITNVNTPREKLQLDWPGKEYFLDTKEGLALLGTPHLTGIVWMLHDHHDLIKKTIGSIRIFTKGSSYFILVYLK
ncbi:MAG: hypothetical protein Q9179_005884, partial [Wetmoreana sp. 5 TL-2023]